MVVLSGALLEKKIWWLWHEMPLATHSRFFTYRSRVCLSKLIFVIISIVNGAEVNALWAPFFHILYFCNIDLRWLNWRNRSRCALKVFREVVIILPLREIQLILDLHSLLELKEVHSLTEILVLKMLVFIRNGVLIEFGRWFLVIIRIHFDHWFNWAKRLLDLLDFWVLHGGLNFLWALDDLSQALVDRLLIHLLFYLLDHSVARGLDYSIARDLILVWKSFLVP